MSPYPILYYIIGLDLGRDRDHSAIAVMAIRREDAGPFNRATHSQPTRPYLSLGALQRIPLGTEYTEVVTILRQIVSRLHSAADPYARPVRIIIVMDAAGPGQVVMELLRAARMDVQVVPTVLSSGFEPGHTPTGKVTIPRRQLVSHLRYVLETETLRVNEGLFHLGDLEEEIAALRPEGSQTEHDDLAIALGLAVWHAAKVFPDLLQIDRAA